MLIVAIVVKRYPPNPNAPRIAPPGIASIAMVFLESASYNASWGPMSWILVGEMFSGQNREIGAAIGTSSQWLFNFTLAKITPYALADIGAFGTFLMFSCFNYALVPYVYFVIKEVSLIRGIRGWMMLTRNRLLENLSSKLIVNSKRSRTTTHQI